MNRRPTDFLGFSDFLEISIMVIVGLEEEAAEMNAGKNMKLFGVL